MEFVKMEIKFKGQFQGLVDITLDETIICNISIYVANIHIYVGVCKYIDEEY